LSNNYTYFKHKNISGPKSLIKYLSLLEQNNCKLWLYTNDIKKIGNFPFSIKLKEFPKLTNVLQFMHVDLIIVDRANIILGLLLSFLFRKKIILRILGNGFRLNSKKIFSYRNLITLLTFFKKIDLVISTCDGSSKHGPTFIKTRSLRHRVNGIPNLKIQNNVINENEFYSVCRYSKNDEKGLKKIIDFFSNLLNKNTALKLHLFGPTNNDLTELQPIKAYRKSINAYGFISLEEIEELSKNCKYMISCNLSGCLGNAELESIANEKPIIYLGPKSNLEKLNNEYRRSFINGEEYFHNVKKIKFPKIENFNSVHEKDVVETMNLLGN